MKITTHGGTTDASDQSPAPASLAPLNGSLVLPALNDDIKEILSMMPWSSARIARRLDALKLYEVKRKCEEEQAAAMHWMLSLYLVHGKEWRTVGEKILKGEAPENDQALPQPPDGNGGAQRKDTNEN